MRLGRAGVPIVQRARRQPVNGRPGAPLGLQRQIAGRRQTIERLVPGPTGDGYDMGDQRVEIDFPGDGDASGAAGSLRGRRPAALATDGKAWIRSPTEKGSDRKSS